MKRRFYYSVFLVFIGASLLHSCGMGQNDKKEKSMSEFTSRDGEVKLVVLDPGHFHASLLQKFPKRQVNDTVFVYAPEGKEIDQYMASINSYNNRQENPTNWHIELYSGKDYLKKMIDDKSGNVVILAGNNSKKTDYIAQSIKAGYHVLSDKPMAISKENFNLLAGSFHTAQINDTYLLDVMTERNEIINTLTRSLLNRKPLFGELDTGTPDQPAVVMESVHHYYKEVSGNVLIRPTWFYDVEQQGEGIADVSVHLIDLINWQCFPDQVIDYKKDIRVLSANHWPTRLNIDDFYKSTKANEFPGFLQKYVKNDFLEVYGNGKIDYQVNNKNISVTVRWDYEAPKGGSDTYNALIRGTKTDIEIVQNVSTNYKKELFVRKNKAMSEKEFDVEIIRTVTDMQQVYPWLSAVKVTEGRYQIIAPMEFRKGHEDYFGMVADNFFNYLVHQNLPDWELRNTLAKYYITTTALEMTKEN